MYDLPMGKSLKPSVKYKYQYYSVAISIMALSMF